MTVPENAVRLLTQEYDRLRADSVSHSREDCLRRGLEAAAPAILAARDKQVRQAVIEAGPRCPADPETATAWLREKAFRFAGNARAVSGPAADRQWAIFLAEIAAYAAAAAAAGAPPPGRDDDAGAVPASGTAPRARKPAAGRTSRPGSAKAGS